MTELEPLSTGYGEDRSDLKNPDQPLAENLFSNNPAGIEIRTEIPTEVTIGEIFEISIMIVNASNKNQVLKRVVMPVDFVTSLEDLRSIPPFSRISPTFTGLYRAFVFDLDIPPRGLLLVRFLASGRRSGSHILDLDICFNNLANCKLIWRQIAIQDRSE